MPNSLNLSGRFMMALGPAGIHHAPAPKMPEPKRPAKLLEMSRKKKR